MHIIKQRRNELNKLTLTELANRVGVPKQTLSDIESGLYLPSPELARKLEKELKITGLPDTSHTMTEREMRSIFKPRPFRFKPVDQRCWGVLETRLQFQMRKLKLKQELLEWLKRHVPADSLTECLSYCCLLQAGATCIFANPHRLGFRRQPVLNSDGLALADELLPAFRWKINDHPCILWPQVKVLTATGQFRLDYLVLYRGQWYNLEIDGPLHNAADDEYRRRSLGLPDVRISHKTVTALQFTTFLSNALTELTRHLSDAA